MDDWASLGVTYAALIWVKEVTATILKFEKVSQPNTLQLGHISSLEEKKQRTGEVVQGAEEIPVPGNLNLISIIHIKI